MHPLASLQVEFGSVAIHWFEQSTFAVKDSHGTTMMVDPYFPTERPASSFKYSTPPLDESTLPLNYVLLTHNHGDHTCPESLIRIHESFPDVQYIGPSESTENIANSTPIPSEQVTTINAGDEVNMGTMTAHVVYAKAPEGDPDQNILPPDVAHLGFVVRCGEIGIYFSGDVFNTFALRDDLVDEVVSHEPDIGFLTNHPDEGEFPFFEGSVEMAMKIGLKHVCPAHYECFVSRDYDPQEWAAGFPQPGPKPLIIPRNTHIIYPG